MKKKIKFIFKNVIRLFICSFFNLFIKRNNNYIIAALRVGRDRFSDNTKYLFLQYEHSKYIHLFWLCDDKIMRDKFLNYGFKNVFARNSLKGIYYTLKSKYWLYDFFPTSISDYWSSGATFINLWHGIPLKKIENDARNLPINKIPLFQKHIYDLLKIKHSYFIVNSEYEIQHYQTAFVETKEKMQILGSPRLDVLLHDIPNAEIFMEKDFKAIKSFKEQGKKIFIYMPTFRDTGKDISSWLKSDGLKQFLSDNNAILVCKLHPFDKNSLDFKLTEEFYKMDSNSDIYPVLKYSDALISDYSSIAFDYLLLDKPIIYHVPDLQEYQDTCRGFYMPYEEFAVGEITRNEEEILSAMKNVIDGVDNYKEQRKVLRDKMFKYQDGKNCERVIEWIKSLDK